MSHLTEADDVGTYGGLCNRTVCRAPDSYWWNSSTRKWYCVECASKINLECRRFKENPICEFRDEP